MIRESVHMGSTVAVTMIAMIEWLAPQGLPASRPSFKMQPMKSLLADSLSGGKY